MKKLSPTQSTVLRLIANRSGGVWYPAYEEYLEGEFVRVAGSGFANAIKALWRKGLAKPIAGAANEYASEITDKGREIALKEAGKPVRT